jgi:hypothetical protein
MLSKVKRGKPGKTSHGVSPLKNMPKSKRILSLESAEK